MSRWGQFINFYPPPNCQEVNSSPPIHFVAGGHLKCQGLRYGRYKSGKLRGGLCATCELFLRCVNFAGGLMREIQIILAGYCVNRIVVI